MVTTNKVAEEVNLSIGTKYRYFKNKEDIRNQAFKRNVEKSKEKLNDCYENLDKMKYRKNKIVRFTIFLGSSERKYLSKSIRSRTSSLHGDFQRI